MVSSCILEPSPARFCVNWWCMDFNLFPLLPINYTSSYCPNIHTHTHIGYDFVREGESGSSVYFWWYQQYQNSNLSLIQCLFIMHFNYVKTHPLSHRFGQLRVLASTAAVVATALLCYKTERRPPSTTSIALHIADKQQLVMNIQ